MENVSEILPALLAKAKGQKNNAILFGYQFNNLRVRGVFFGQSVTLTIGISDKNVAWQCDIANGVLYERVPHEVYLEIGKALVDAGEKRTNKPFFLKLKKVLESIPNENKVYSPTDNEILDLLSDCKTHDKKYDKEGEKPFFDHWRRVRPSSSSLIKIQRYFGKDVREECYRNKATAVWSHSPKENSLIFLEPKTAIKEILDAKTIAYGANRSKNL